MDSLLLVFVVVGILLNIFLIFNIFFTYKNLKKAIILGEPFYDDDETEFKTIPTGIKIENKNTGFFSLQKDIVENRPIYIEGIEYIVKSNNELLQKP